MTTKTRLQKAEKAYRQRHGKSIEIYVIFPDHVVHNGETMTWAEYENRPKGDRNTIINVQYEESKRINDMGMAGELTIKL